MTWHDFHARNDPGHACRHGVGQSSPPIGDSCNRGTSDTKSALGNCVGGTAPRGRCPFAGVSLLVVEALVDALALFFRATAQQNPTMQPPVAQRQCILSG